MATVANTAASEGLFRLGFASDLVAFVWDAVIEVLFYVLLRLVGKTLSLVAAALRLLAHPIIASVNKLCHFAALPLLGGAGYLSVFEPEEPDALALQALDLHGYGYLIGGAFFGVHCLVLGYLLFRSGLFLGCWRSRADGFVDRSDERYEHRQLCREAQDADERGPKRAAISRIPTSSSFPLR